MIYPLYNGNITHSFYMGYDLGLLYLFANLRFVDMFCCIVILAHYMFYVIFRSFKKESNNGCECG